MSTGDGPGPPREQHGRRPESGDRRAYIWLAERHDELRRSHDRLVEQIALVASDSSEILPRLDDVEESLERLGAALEAGGVGDDRAAQSDAVTPATRWSQLGHDEVVAAWDALGGWVAEVLNSEYELSRVQLPDCWPVHRRAVRELAWLRTLHGATRGPSVSREVVAEWHSRWLPAALYNVASAIDPRECAPGRHRVTDAERRHYQRQREEAQQGQGGDPVLTTEQGVNRPRYFPGMTPPRRGRDEDVDRSGPGSTAPLPLDDLTPPPVSEREHWWPYLLDARHADLASAYEREATESS